MIYIFYSIIKSPIRAIFRTDEEFENRNSKFFQKFKGAFRNIETKKQSPSKNTSKTSFQNFKMHFSKGTTFEF